ncbi:M14 family metallopeptidase [Flavilitoribacter nigricans]|uniref:Peptidase n=1 Tax=Flavilitoribacter nigricans (strain ATCC 23147 / DSM 23189 / NBRC 102662 / NCIMB 1420 / SS-2) TaxID=1122177 RepID=A0A2D0MZH8_FLAN2|nr:M14 family metallopeptidase [Flavilitoribacter nigricans]PHN01655.1 peptidase [Flavilitoribacter nigricans DSM 23189 = NBRC 102662]
MQHHPFLLTLLFSAFTLALPAQERYHSPDELETSIRQLERQYSDWLEVSSLAKTVEGEDIWLLTIGSGPTAEHPALVVAGGVDGSHLIGTELALGVARELLAGAGTDSIRQLLATTTFYIFPQLAPDAAKQYFADLRYERHLNGRATDNDRDGYTDEDPYEDLNGDGMITMMRISDPTGNYLPHPADERILTKAKSDAGTSGQYRILTEGTDNDHDGNFNEDGPGGINFNENLTFNYEPFQAGSGEYAVSEPESRAVLDFLYNHWNIFAVLTFGPSDNLAAPMEYKPSNRQGRKISGILQEDAGVNKMLSELYGEFVKPPKGAKTTTQGGGFMEWAYFHFGRFSFGTPGWYLPTWEMPKDSTEREKFKPNEDKNKEVDFLRWAEDAGLEEAFVPWTAVEHPDFPGQTVEVGGIAPFVMTNPPYSEVPALVKKHTEFVMALAKKRPQVELVNVRSEKVDDGLWRVKAAVYNSGDMPTTSEIGDRVKWLKSLRIDLKLANGQELISGRKVTLLSSVAGGGSSEMSWLIKGNGNISIEASAPHCGRSEESLNLR